ncbi:MAG TPA: ABC transporter permease [Pseudomonadales bacterium]
MSGAIFRAMLLGLVRDRGALLMSFFLPAVFFMIMAEIFTATTGEALNLKVAVLDEVGSQTSSRLTTALAEMDSLTVIPAAATPTRDAVRSLVKSGDADIGLIIRADADSLDEAGGFGAPPLLVVTDPARGVAEPMLTGQIRRAYFGALPDVAMGNVVAELENQFLTLTDDQREEVDDGLLEMREEAAAGREVGWSFEDLLDRESVIGGEAVNLVAYSAGAVAFMFLLFASVHGAVSLLEEQESGILDRVLAGPGGIGVLVDGKFLYVVGQGLVQVSVIFAVAWLGYGVDVPGQLGAWLVISVAASLACAGLAMLLATACQTRRQAQTIANTVILVLSAVGGSMVPRFLMPDLLKDVGWITPNTWALEAYSGIFWRGEGLHDVVLPVALLAMTGIIGWLAARSLAHRRAYGD